MGQQVDTGIPPCVQEDFTEFRAGEEHVFSCEKDEKAR